MDRDGVCFILVAWLSGVAVLMWWLPRWIRHRARKRLAAWAESNGYGIEEFSLPRHENQMGARTVFRVTIMDADGKHRDADVSFPVWFGGEPRVEWF